MNLANKATKESPNSERIVKFEFLEDIKSEMVSINPISKDTKYIFNFPIEAYNFVVSKSLSIPSDDSLSSFIYWYFGDYFNDNVDTDDHEYMKQNLLNLIVTVLIQNINPQSIPDKSNVPELEKEQKKNVENH